MKAALLILMSIFSVAPWAAAVDHLDIDIQRKPDYLPYEAIVLASPPLPVGRISLPLPAQALHHDSNGTLIQMAAYATNPATRDGTPAGIVFTTVADWQITRPCAVSLILSDFRLVYSGTAGIVAIACGYRQDSAFVCKVFPDGRPTIYHLIATGCDRSRAEWRGIREFLLVSDIDGDGHPEGLFHLGSAKSLTEKRLYCLDLETLDIEWTVPFPYYATVAEAASIDPGQPQSLFMIAHNCRPEVTNPTYADLYSHLLRLSGHGDIISDRFIGRTGAILTLEYDSRHRTLYFTHGFPPTATFGAADSATAGNYLGALDCASDRIISVALPAAAPDIWTGDYTHDSTDDVYTVSDDGYVRVYDSSLNLIAESDRIPSLRSFGGKVAPLEGTDSLMTFVFPDCLALYSSDFRRMAVIPTEGHMAQTMGMANGQLSSVLVTSFEGYTAALVKKRSAWGYLAVLYLDYRYYVLLAVTFLLISLCIAAYYGRHIRRQKRQLEFAHRELTGAHEALKQAQDKLVAQEKQRLAQTLAGGFAHEVRNALFPAQMSIFKLTDGVDPERQKKLLSLISQSVTRAMSLTELISQYTKLELQYQPEPTSLATVLREALSANTEQIEHQGVTVCSEGSEESILAIRGQHLYMILNNLLLNALDAVDTKDHPTITVRWSEQPARTTIWFADNGHGISKDDREHIFDAFYTTKPDRGTGIGLAIVRKLTDMYGGAIALANQPGPGAAFELTFPRWSDPSSPSDSAGATE